MKFSIMLTQALLIIVATVAAANVFGAVRNVQLRNSCLAAGYSSYHYSLVFPNYCSKVVNGNTVVVVK